MLDAELNSILKLSLQRALLGEIYPEIRAVSFDNEGLKKLRIVYYLDRKPIEADYESLGSVLAEVLADVDFEQIEEVCEYTEVPFSSLKTKNLVYLRKEF